MYNMENETYLFFINGLPFWTNITLWVAATFDIFFSEVQYIFAQSFLQISTTS